MSRRRDFLAQGTEPDALDENSLFQFEEPTQSAPDEAGEFADQEAAPAETYGDEPAWEDDASHAVDPTTLAPPVSRRAAYEAAAAVEEAPAPPPGGPSMATWFGAALLLGGLGLATAGAFAPASVRGLLDALARAGTPPALLTVAGLVLVAVGGLARRMHRADQRIEQLAELAGDANEQQYALGGSVQKLLEELGSTDDSIESGGLHRIIHILHRLDEKTNNLTRAFKMYGKPLIDIAKQVSQVEVAVRETHETLGSQSQQWTQAQTALAELGEAVQTAGQQLRSGFERTEAGLRGLAGRGEDPRIGQLAGQLEALGRTLAEAVENRFSKLESGLDERTRAVTAGIDRVMQQVAGPSTGADLAGALDSIRKDLSGLGQQIKAVASARPAATAPGRATEPVAAQPAPAAEPRGEPTAAGGLAQSIAGTKSGSNKNVMSAIEKLKNLRK